MYIFINIYKLFIIIHCNHCINLLLLYDYYTNLKNIKFTIYSNLLLSFLPFGRSVEAA